MLHLELLIKYEHFLLSYYILYKNSYRFSSSSGEYGRFKGELWKYDY